MGNGECRQACFRIPNSAFRIRERGSVLIYIVWILMLLSLFVTSISSQALFAMDLSSRLLAQLKAAYIARAAVPYAALVLERDDTPAVDAQHEEWSNNPEQFQHHAVGEGAFTLRGERPDGEGEAWYGLVDEERWINLNTAPIEVLARLVEVAADLQEGEAAEIAESIADWRDEDRKRHPLGAEGSYYRSMGYECKDGPFENVEELLLVKGISPEIYGRIHRHVTVFGSGAVNLNTATTTTLRALGLSWVGVNGLLAYRAGEDGEAGTEDDWALPSIHGLGGELGAFVPLGEVIRLGQLAQDDLLAVRSEAFRMTIEATATGESNSRISVACVIDRDGQIKQWMER